MNQLSVEPNLEPEEPPDYSRAMNAIEYAYPSLPYQSPGTRAYTEARRVFMSEWPDMLAEGTHPHDLIADINDAMTGLERFKEEILELFTRD